MHWPAAVGVLLAVLYTKLSKEVGSMHSQSAVGVVSHNSMHTRCYSAASRQKKALLLANTSRAVHLIHRKVATKTLLVRC